MAWLPSLRARVARRFPDPMLALLSALWLAGGLAGAIVFPLKGNPVMGAACFGVGGLAFGLWVGWTWVRVPLFLLNLFSVVSGSILVVMKGMTDRSAIRLVVAGYAAYLVWTWWPPGKPAPARRTGLKGAVRLCLSASVALFLLVLAYAAAASVLAARWAARNEAEWARLVPTGVAFDLLPRRPEPSAAARDVECACAKLGMDVATVGAPKRCRPGREARRSFEPFDACARDWLREELSHPGQEVRPPPVEIDRFIAAHASSLDALERLALSGREMAWELDAAKLHRAPEPNVTGHVSLHRLAVTLALHRASRADMDGARRALEMSWSLAAGLRDRPDMTSSLLASSAARYQLGALRKLRGAPGPWMARLQLLGSTEGALRSMAYETWSFGSILRGFPLGEPPKKGDWGDWFFHALLRSPFGRTYLALCAESLSQRACRAAAELQAGDLCRLDPEAFDRARHDGIPRWNLFRRMTMEAIAGRWRRIASLEPDAELTRLVVTAEEHRARTGAWPSSLDDARSAACHGLVWHYAVTPQGGVTIAPSCEPPRDPKALALATTFLAPAPARPGDDHRESPGEP